MDIKSKKEEILIKNINAWKNKLLDLTLKNKALNLSLKLGKSFPSKMQIIYPSLEDFMKIIDSSNREIFSLEQYKSIKDYTKLPDGKQVIYSHTLEEVLSKNELKKTKIYTEFGGEIFVNTIKKIAKTAKAFKDQFSIDIMYLTFGILQWYEDKTSETPRFAPLLFLPIEINKSLDSGDWNISIKKESFFDENQALNKKLSNEFDINVKFDSNDEDDLFTNYQQYCNSILEKSTDKRWKVHNKIFLTNYDFSNINIYKDIETNITTILNSAFFEELVNPTKGLDSDISQINDKNINEKIDIASQYKTLDSDSSQEVAIQNAINNKSFILQGPPGTGKSQTITNIITELISRGKKILFVAEKNAALQVVYNNLKKIDLHKYAIPIHDSKVNKKEILTELLNSAENSKLYEIDESKLNNLTYSYNQSKIVLSKYGELLLTKFGPQNLTLYECIEKYLSLQEYQNIYFIIDDINNIDYQTFDNTIKNINSFLDAYKNINFNYFSHKWHGLKISGLSFEQKNQLFKNIDFLIRNSTNILKYVKENNLLINNSQIDENFTKNILNINKVLNFYQKANFKNNKQDFTFEDLKNTLQQLHKIEQLWMKKDETITSLKKTWNSLNFIDPKQVIETYNFINKKSKSIFKSLSPFFHKTKKIFKNNLKSELNFEEIDWIEELRKFSLIKEIEQQILDIFDNLKIDFSISKYQELQNWISEINYILEINDIIQIFNTLWKSLFSLQNFQSLNDQFQQYVDKLKNLILLYNKDEFDFTNVSYVNFRSKLNDLISQPEKLDEYLELNKYKNELLIHNHDFIQKVLENKITSNLKEIYLVVFYKTLIENAIDSNFCESDAIYLNNNLEIFKNKDIDLKQLSKERIAMSIDEKIKKSLLFSDSNTQYALIKKEAAKKYSRLSFKKIFEKALDFILNIKPCLMLSPLTVSQFFKDIDFKFDTVIFDEASQIKPEAAISSLFRAKQVIIVGDKEQMPPSNFFGSVSNEDNDSEIKNVDEDVSSGFDSLLSLAEGALNSIKLKWHYRSLFEELIYTSNSEIYKDLITFPSAKNPSKFEGLKFFKVEYDEMKSEDSLIKKTMSILKELISKYKDKYSVGIVVFNVDIVNKVENELEKFIHNNPKLNYFFDENKKEPFFIKNIDAVQGDERDFIFFIIEGKKNANQRVSVNFGAINREDSGYKRLNVAISRAKKGLILISNFNSSEVDWHKSDKRGIQLLEQFFKNAEYGIKNDVESIDFNKSNASFIDHVYNELSKYGLSLKKNIGSSSFKIDIAIIDNNNPDNFLLAINCDGNSYKLAKTDRDRDRLMQQILESRGWNFIRIWSVDWYKNPQKQLNLILNKVKEIIENNTSNNLTQDTTKKIPKISYIKENKKGLDHIFSVYPDVENLIKKYSFEYRQSTFINQKAQIAKNIIDVLAPISFEAFCRIIRDLNQMNSVNKAIKLEALKIVNKIATFDDDNEFILSNEKDDNKYKFRISTNQNNKRSIQDIYEPELVDIILTILSYNDIPTDLTAIVKEICVKTQTMRVTTQITNRIKDLINKLVLSNKILKVDENTYQIVK
ncbi:DUF4011 domain-containing protein [Mycoplasmopsis cynos]|uniref:DUF4011 domain-containing protein n=1 Tax=Mycoplasmopsis cynos TaxID=171284 RepID=UPI002AFFA818|nr:DUF4011 domain-containing protein [Mycoplasmopsis cynos]WQQ15533.1 DUF4011 domain-containing protein [Mycoplasmopsis cynos]